MSGYAWDAPRLPLGVAVLAVLSSLVGAIVLTAGAFLLAYFDLRAPKRAGSSAPRTGKNDTGEHRE